MTEWRWVPGREGRYEVSDQGQIRSYVRYPEGRLLKTPLGTHGYPTIQFGAGVARRTVHSVVAAAFIGPRPEGLEVAHLNGVRNDPRAVNLVYVTHRENNSHKKMHGTEPMGETHHNAKLTDAQVCEIRELIAAGRTLHRVIAERFGVSQTHVSRIGRGVRRAETA